MVRIIIAVMLIGHGLAHVSGFLISWTKTEEGFKITKPWIFSQNVLIKSRIGKVFGIFWALALLCFVGAGLSIFFHFYDWKILATIGVVFSLISIIPWWSTVPLGAKIGLVFDLIVFAYLVYFNPMV
ncbi:hypothetical protein ACFLSE_00315 [Bacteroidota bacterium]